MAAEDLAVGSGFLRDLDSSLRGAFEAAMALVEEHAEEREPVRIQVDATSEAELEAATEEAALAEAAAETEALR